MHFVRVHVRFFGFDSVSRVLFTVFHRPRALLQAPTGAGTTTAEPEGVSVCAYVSLYHAEVLLAC